MRLVLTGVSAIVFLSACSRSNNLLLGRVEAKVGEHLIVVTDCYRTNAPPPQRLNDSADGKPVYSYAPCRDANIVIRGEELMVNGTSYGQLAHGDAVTVDHGKVLINGREARVAASK